MLAHLDQVVTAAAAAVAVLVEMNVLQAMRELVLRAVALDVQQAVRVLVRADREILELMVLMEPMAVMERMVMPERLVLMDLKYLVFGLLALKRATALMDVVALALAAVAAVADKIAPFATMVQVMVLAAAAAAVKVVLLEQAEQVVAVLLPFTPVKMEPMDNSLIAMLMQEAQVWVDKVVLADKAAAADKVVLVQQLAQAKLAKVETVATEVLVEAAVLEEMEPMA
jgi:hypothetical protein